MMRDGGVWGVPRSGLMFQRRGDTLVNTMRMPFMPEMADPSKNCPHTAAELEALQEQDFQQHVEHFAAAGITVTKETPQ
jgi:hypothetical protein